MSEQGETSDLQHVTEASDALPLDSTGQIEPVAPAVESAPTEDAPITSEVEMQLYQEQLIRYQQQQLQAQQLQAQHDVSHHSNSTIGIPSDQYQQPQQFLAGTYEQHLMSNSIQSQQMLLQAMTNPAYLAAYQQHLAAASELHHHHHQMPTHQPTLVQSVSSSDRNSFDNSIDGDTGSEAVTRCLCGNNDDQDGFMISCDRCSVWQHGECVGVDEHSAPDQYICEQCEPTHPIHVRRAEMQSQGHEFGRKSGVVCGHSSVFF